MDFLDKLRKKPKQERKIILWSVVTVIGLTLLIIWLYNSYQAITKFKEQNIMQGINISSMEIPTLSLDEPKLPDEILEITTQ